MGKTPDDRYIVQWPPALICMPISGKLYAVSGQLWIEVPDNTTRADIKPMFCWGAEADKFLNPKKFLQEKEVWEIKGSKGNIYKVARQGKSWNCPCTGFKYHNKCKHVTNLQILYPS